MYKCKLLFALFFTFEIMNENFARSGSQEWPGPQLVTGKDSVPFISVQNNAYFYFFSSSTTKALMPSYFFKKGNYFK